MNKDRILQILENVFGKGKKQSKGEFLFYCPSCHHHKPKLIVKIDPAFARFQSWHCWVCGKTNGTRGGTLIGLLTKFKASDYQIREMKKIVGDKRYVPKLEEEPEKTVQLPAEYTPLWNEEDSIAKRHALVSLRKRNITTQDFLRYQIGYCSDGDFADRIIVPSFNDEGTLNYFVARAFYNDAYLKYKNPDASKNIVAFDMFINWQLPIVLVEGVFDAIATRRNAIPLLGKTISDRLFEKIVMQRPPAVYIALDQDAIRDSIVIAERLIREEIPTHIILLEEKDPSDLGFEKMIFAMNNNTLTIDESSIFKLKMKYNVN